MMIAAEQLLKETPRYDWLIVTASNRNQAASYRQQLAARRPTDGSECEISGCRRVLVVPDPHGKRAGSGGSTFAVLVELARELLKLRPTANSLIDLFADQQILILHSGGDARRLPPYAAQGKIFVPVPAISPAGQPLTLFDKVLDDFCSLPRSHTGRLTIAAGDLYLRLAQARPGFHAEGVTGLSCDSPVDRGTRHGVYITNMYNEVTGFLQKPSPEVMKSAGAIAANGNVKVDTGTLSIDWPTICRWLESLGLRIKRGQLELSGLIADITDARAGAIDLYEHILCMLAPGGAPSKPLPAAVNTALVNAFKDTRLSLCHVAQLDFLHLGSSRELLELGIQRIWGDSFSISKERVALLSSDPGRARAIGSAFIENSHPGAIARLDGMNLLINVPAQSTLGMRLNLASCAAWIPIDDDKWILLRYPLDFDWKATSPAAILQFFEGRGALDKSLVFKGDAYLQALFPSGGDITAFHARYFCVGTIAQIDSLERRLHASPSRTHNAAEKEWLASERISLADLATRANLSRIQDQHALNTRRWLSLNAKAALLTCPLLPTARILDICTQDPSLRDLWLNAIHELENPPEPSRWVKVPTISPGTSVRLARVKSVLQSDLLVAQWSPSVRQALAACAPAPRATPPIETSLVHPPREVSVSLPARIDLAGGWTDTPPICTDSGGLVINLAIKLSGTSPVRATVRSTSAASITIKSLDQNQKVELPLSQPLALTDTSDWSSLARAAIGVTLASISDSPARPLGDYLASGLEISFESAVPKGSGLGTSSILAAAIVAALRTFQGRDPNLTSNPDELHQICRRVSAIEQTIGSCGGWQDQYGGLVPGLKSLETLAGLNQSPAISRFSLNSRIGALLRERTLLYYTGQQRLAANILQRFVCHCLDRDPATLRVVRGIQSTARNLLTSLRTDDPDSFVQQVTRYWLYKRQIDSSASNPMIDSIIATASPDLDGYLLPGAGGGGFLLFFASSIEAKSRIIDRLTKTPPNPDARFYELEVDESGPQISISH